jgi:hypothetical protein
MTTTEQATQRWNKERDEHGDFYTSRCGDYQLRVWSGLVSGFIAVVDTGLMRARTFHDTLESTQSWCVETADRMRAETGA